MKSKIVPVGERNYSLQAAVDSLYIQDKAFEEPLCDFILEYVDDMCSEGAFDTVDTFLDAIDVQRLSRISTLAVIMVLSSTLAPERNGKLKKRKDFVLRARKHLEETEGNRTEALLEGLL